MLSPPYFTVVLFQAVLLHPHFRLCALSLSSAHDPSYLTSSLAMLTVLLSSMKDPNPCYLHPFGQRRALSAHLVFSIMCTVTCDRGDTGGFRMSSYGVEGSGMKGGGDNDERR